MVIWTSAAEEVDSDGEEVQLCCQCGLPVGETAYRPEEKAPKPSGWSDCYEVSPGSQFVNGVKMGPL